MTTKVIMISGKSSSGKDQLAKYIIEVIEKKHGMYKVMHFADLVKAYATLYYDWNGEKDEKGRALLQFIGTELMRKRYPTYWAEIIGKLIDAICWIDPVDYVIIPDWRFINEYETLASYYLDIYRVRVNRTDEYGNTYRNPDMTDEQFNHISECELDCYEFDQIVDNNGTLDDLREAAKDIVDCVDAVFDVDELFDYTDI